MCSCIKTGLETALDRQVEATEATCLKKKLRGCKELWIGNVEEKGHDLGLGGHS